MIVFVDGASPCGIFIIRYILNKSSIDDRKLASKYHLWFAYVVIALNAVFLYAVIPDGGLLVVSLPVI